jgi:hypothetical protein
MRSSTTSCTAFITGVMSLTIASRICWSSGRTRPL